MIIQVRDVWKEYPNQTLALRGVSLQINEGELLLIMGPSGSGKSTLLHMIGLLDVPSKGEVRIKGKKAPVNEDARAEIRSKLIGFVFQDFGLISSLTALENILLPAIFTGELVKDRAVKLAKMLGIAHRLNHYPAQLSGGEKQRVAIARALINDPEVILADEPTGNLDSKTGDQVMNILRKLADSGKAVVVVTHNPEHEKFADRIARIKDGKILEVENRLKGGD